MKIGVVIPILNRFEMAIDALASVKTKHDWEPIIIPNYRLELSVAESWNKGIMSAFEKGCKYVIVMNDDVLLSPLAIDTLIDFMEDRDNTGNGNISLVSGLDMKINNRLSNPDDVLTLMDSNMEISADGADFSFFCLDKNTILNHGWFDTEFLVAYFEDCDYAYRIFLGGKASCAIHAFFYHFGSQTQLSDPSKPIVDTELFIYNRMHYISKWGGTPGMESVKTL